MRAKNSTRFSNIFFSTDIYIYIPPFQKDGMPVLWDDKVVLNDCAFLKMH